MSEFNGYAGFFPQKREEEHKHDEPYDEVMARLVRIESRLCQLMERLGFDPQEHYDRRPK